MAATYKLYAGDAITRNFGVTFPYLDKSHVQVAINGVVTQAYTWLNDSMVQLAVAPPVNAVIEVRRYTPTVSPVDFTDGSVLGEAQLDMLATYSAFLAQEALENAETALRTDSTGALSARNLRLANVADPVSAQDAVTKAWAETAQTAQLQLAITARVAAESARGTAVDAKDTAVGAKDQAVSARVAAEGARDVANQSRDTAVQARVDTVAARDVTTGARDTTLAARDTAVGARDTAVTKAGEASTSATNSYNSAQQAANSAASVDAARLVKKDSDTGAAWVPSGTTGQRPGVVQLGQFRFNESLNKFEGYSSGGWGSVGGGATGGGSDAVFIENDQAVTQNYSLSPGKNAGSFGPITINNNVTVTIPDGAVWSIV